MGSSSSDLHEKFEKPQNGLAGLKHWRYDVRSGFMVALVSLPFSMGIAITSGAPPVCGIVSAIIAGFLLPFLGGSYVTISGPAAGLAPAIYAGMITLGTVQLGTSASTDDLLKAGYPLVLVAIGLAGIFQVVLAKLKVARLSAIFPAAAIEGVLAAIGLMIIVKQVPLFFGEKFEAHEFWGILEEVPAHLASMNLSVFGVGIGCLTLLFILAAIPARLLKIMPPPVWVFFLGTVVAQLFLSIDKSQLINVPEAPLANGIVFPEFRAAFTNAQLWLPLAYLVVTLLLIDGTESLATIVAVDKIDPFHRRSDPDRTLTAMGASNMASSFLGGLTIIPGIVKSTANILGGGRTQWANFYNACFLLIFLVFARDLINLVPKAVLAAILVYIGFKLCRPRVWRHVADIGTEQLLIFLVTVLVTVTTDLLIGVAAGVGLKLVITLWYTGLWYRLNAETPEPTPGAFRRMIDLFRNPVGERQYHDGVFDLRFNRPLVCFNLFHVIRELDQIPRQARLVRIHLDKDLALVDHTSYALLLYYMDEFSSRHDGAITLTLATGWDRMRPLSSHPSSMRLALTGEGVSAPSAGDEPITAKRVAVYADNGAAVPVGPAVETNGHGNPY